MLRPFLAALALLPAGVTSAAETAPAAPPAPPAAAAPAPAGVLLDRVVAIVNEGIVTESEVEEQVQNIMIRLSQSQTTPPPLAVLRQQVLERLVVQEVQMQRAERLGLKITDEQVNAALAEVARDNGLTLAQLPAALAQQGVNYASYRENARKELTLRSLQQREVLGRINVTPRELEQFIERLKKLPDENAEYDVSHILIAIPSEATQAQVDELAARAQEVYERAANEDFGRLAVIFSNSQTALEGGKLGIRKGPELPTNLADTIIALKPGEVSKPLALPDGFHIVKLNEVRSTRGSPIEDQVHVRHILIKPNELEDDATVRQKLAGIRERILKGEEFAAFASSMSEDSGSAVNGGDLDWNGPGTFVPEFEAEVAKLADNEISAPFRTQFGWHIVQLLGRRQFDTTEESLRQRAFLQLRESKADEETELWLRRLRDEAFIDTNI